MGKHLGIYLGHDTGIAITDKDEKPILILEESKFCGVKTPFFYPYFTIKEIINSGYKDFDALCWGFSKNINDNAYHKKYFKYLEIISNSLSEYLSKKLTWKRTNYVSHHLSHAYSAFLPSGFKKAIVLIIDGSGEDESLSIYKADRNNKTLFEKIYSQKTVEFSFGGLYSLITKYLGYSSGHHSEHCGKIMGLGSYGKGKYSKEFEENLLVKNDILNWHGNNSSEFLNFIQGKFGYHKNNITDIFNNQNIEIAASVQKILEKYVIELLIKMRCDFTGFNKLCLAGGVAMNSSLNNMILKADLFNDIFVQPMASDAGIALGASLYSSYNSSKQNKKYYSQGWRNAYYGYSINSNSKEIEKLLNQYDFPLEIIDYKVDQEAISDLLVNDKIVGLIQGAMEVGPRALGNRSILSAPSNKMKDKINLSVKYREHWRPFAPVVLEEHLEDYFERTRPEPFMTVVYDTKKLRDICIEGVTHVDKTGRVQTVNKKQNKLLYKIIDSFGCKTGTYVLLNTSFNINGQPIVRSIYDAIVTFLSSGIDFLVINNFLIEKKKQIAKENVTALDRKISELISGYNKTNLGVIKLDSEILKILKNISQLPSVIYKKNTTFDTVFCSSHLIRKTIEPLLKPFCREFIVTKKIIPEIISCSDAIFVPIGNNNICEHQNYSRPIYHFVDNEYIDNILELEKSKNSNSIFLIDSNHHVLDVDYFLNVVFKSQKNKKNIIFDENKQIELLYQDVVNINNIYDHVESCIKLYPMSDALILRHLKLCVNKGLRDEAKNIWDMVKLNLKKKIDPLLESQILNILGYNDNAAKKLKGLLSDNPNRIEVKKQLAFIEYSKGNYSKALDLFNSILLKVPLDYLINLRKIDALISLSKHDEARLQLKFIQRCEQVISPIKNNFNIFYDYMKQQIKLEDFDHFRIDINEALNKYPKYLFRFANLYKDINDYSNAIKYYEKVEKIDPMWINARCLRADSFAQIGRKHDFEKEPEKAYYYYCKSLEAFKDILKKHPEKKSILLNISDVYKYLQKYNVAINYLDQYETLCNEHTLIGIKKNQIYNLQKNM